MKNILLKYHFNVINSKKLETSVIWIHDSQIIFYISKLIHNHTSKYSSKLFIEGIHPYCGREDVKIKNFLFLRSPETIFDALLQHFIKKNSTCMSM